MKAAKEEHFTLKFRGKAQSCHWRDFNRLQWFHYLEAKRMINASHMLLSNLNESNGVDLRKREKGNEVKSRSL